MHYHNSSHPVPGLPDISPTSPAKAASIIPWTIIDGEPGFFLQVRTKDAPRNPGGLSAFGGGLAEGETFEQAMLREAGEELVWADGRPYVPAEPTYVGEFPSPEVVVRVWADHVDRDFAERIRVLEGAGGRFFSLGEIVAFPSVRPWLVERVRAVLASVHAKGASSHG